MNTSRESAQVCQTSRPGGDGDGAEGDAVRARGDAYGKAVADDRGLGGVTAVSQCQPNEPCTLRACEFSSPGRPASSGRGQPRPSRTPGTRCATSCATPPASSRCAIALGLDTSDVAVGDMTDRESVRTALEGCDAVVHVAAVVSIDPERADEIIATNHLGAENVVGQAVELGLDPVVYVSSVAGPLLTSPAATPPGSAGRRVERRLRPVEGRRGALRAWTCRSRVLPWRSPIPAWSSGLRRGSSSGSLRSRPRSRSRPAFLPGRHATWSIVDVRDLAELHARLLTPGMGPRRYLAGGTPLTLRQLADEFTKLRGKRFRIVPVPDRWMIGFGKVAELFRPVLKGQLLNFTEASMRYYVDLAPADNTASEKELGMVWRDPRESLAATVQALREHNLI